MRREDIVNILTLEFGLSFNSLSSLIIKVLIEGSKGKVVSVGFLKSRRFFEMKLWFG